MARESDPARQYVINHLLFRDFRMPPVAGDIYKRGGAEDGGNIYGVPTEHSFHTPAEFDVARSVCNTLFRATSTGVDLSSLEPSLVIPPLANSLYTRLEGEFLAVSLVKDIVSQNVLGLTLATAIANPETIAPLRPILAVAGYSGIHRACKNSLTMLQTLATCYNNFEPSIEIEYMFNLLSRSPVLTPVLRNLMRNYSDGQFTEFAWQKQKSSGKEKEDQQIETAILQFAKAGKMEALESLLLFRNRNIHADTKFIHKTHRMIQYDQQTARAYFDFALALNLIAINGKHHFHARHYHTNGYDDNYYVKCIGRLFAEMIQGDTTNALARLPIRDYNRIYTLDWNTIKPIGGTSEMKHFITDFDELLRVMDEATMFQIMQSGGFPSLYDIQAGLLKTIREFDANLNTNSVIKPVLRKFRS